MPRRIALAPVFLAFLAISSGEALRAAPPDAEAAAAVGAPIHVTLELVDGSRLLGAPELRDDRVAFDTKLGRIRVPLRELASIEVAADRESAALNFANGDRLTGFPVEEGLPVKSVLGRLVVPWASVTRCIVNVAPLATGVDSLKPAAISASGWWRESQLPEVAFDGDPATSWSSGDWKGWIEADFGAVHDLAEIRATLQFSPQGDATHEFYVSTTPIGTDRARARLLRAFSGTRDDNDVLSVACPAGTQARFVQIHCPSSRSWFNLFEIEAVPRSSSSTDAD